jgi:hypothetical protein
MRICATFAALAVGLLVACSSGTPASRVISVDGRIGTLRIDHSDAAAVIAFAGRPDAQRRSREFSSSPPYLALGYACTRRRLDTAFPLAKGEPNCRTVYFINARTGKLGDLYTSSGRYTEGHGIRIGMRTADAERLLHRRLYAGCEENIYLGSRAADLTIAFGGGVIRKEPASSGLHVIGGHVFAFVLHGPRNDVGVFDCL